MYYLVPYLYIVGPLNKTNEIGMVLVILYYIRGLDVQLLFYSVRELLLFYWGPECNVLWGYMEVVFLH